MRFDNDLPAIDPGMTVNDIVHRYPDTLRPLGTLGIDTCCGGHLPLEDVARRHGLDPEALLTELRAAAEAAG